MKEKNYTLHKFITVKSERAMCACIHFNLVHYLLAKTVHHNFNFALLGADATEIELNASQLQEVVLQTDNQNIGHTTLDVNLVPTNCCVNLNVRGEIAKIFLITDFLSSTDSIL